ncbi:MAG TPA: hypothetical protein VMD30_03690, partial [Tepidisphaeraceae bacterium]|nr:hypothetical protein [Tepidisphaeraceae bacterium]
MYWAVYKIDMTAVVRLNVELLGSEHADVRDSAAFQMVSLYGDARRNGDLSAAKAAAAAMRPFLNDRDYWVRYYANYVVSDAATRPD